MPDVLLVARHYPDWAALGSGIGNYLAYGEFPEDEAAEPKLFLPRGRVMARVMARVEGVDQAGVTESVTHAWYTYDNDPDGLRNPADGQTNPTYAGPALPYTTLAGSEKYSWLKAPRYDDEPMEVGALARVLVAYVEGRDEVRAAVNRAVTALGVGPDALFGTLGRLVARGDRGRGHRRPAGRLAPAADRQPRRRRPRACRPGPLGPGSWPQEARGWSLGEAPGGALGHWVTIRDQAIASYQIVDASTWNGSPRDGKGRRGAWEEALVGTPVADPGQPARDPADAPLLRPVRGLRGPRLRPRWRRPAPSARRSGSLPMTAAETPCRPSAPRPSAPSTARPPPTGPEGASASTSGRSPSG